MIRKHLMHPLDLKEGDKRGRERRERLAERKRERERERETHGRKINNKLKRLSTTITKGSVRGRGASWEGVKAATFVRDGTAQKRKTK